MLISGPGVCVCVCVCVRALACVHVCGQQEAVYHSLIKKNINILPPVCLMVVFSADDSFLSELSQLLPALKL